MPYKIVQTIENGQMKLTTVPEQWENEGILQYPRKKTEKLRKTENSVPKESWVSMNCVVKRTNLTYTDAEIELTKMCSTSDTETDLEDISSRNQANIGLEDTSNVINFNRIVEECLNNNVPNPEANVEDEVIYISQANKTVQFSIPEIPVQKTPRNKNINLKALESKIEANPVANVEGEVVYFSQDNGTVQFSIPEIPVQKNPLNNNTNLNALESKLEVLTENVKLLSENIIIVQSNQQELFKTQQELFKIQQDILLSLANTNTQFEEFIKKVHLQPEVKENDLDFKRISDQESFDNLEIALEDANFSKDLTKTMSTVCGTYRGKGVNNAYALIDVMFDRKFLKECSWAGGSRSESSKICFKSRSNVVKFFFTVINRADNNFTFTDTQKFFKVILRNSRQRCESQQQRTSVTKTKQQKKKLVQKVQLPPEQKYINPGQSPIVSQRKTESSEPAIQVSERGLVDPEQSTLISQKEPIEGQLIVVPESPNAEPVQVSQGQ